MPVTSRLLQRLTETLGDDATNDLLVWFDEANAVNRAVVRDMADAYFARFDARLEQRFSEANARLEQRFAEANARLEQRLAETKAELRQEIGVLRTDLASQRADLIKWMFVFWIGTIVPLAGLIIALDRL
jgi:hypothetical protein